MERVRDYDAWIGYDAYDRNGDKVGGIDQIFYDDATGRPEWVAEAVKLAAQGHSLRDIGHKLTRHPSTVAKALDRAAATPQIPKATFNAGDLVVLKSGSPVMVVGGVTKTGTAWCAWWNEDKCFPEEHEFVSSTLKAFQGR